MLESQKSKRISRVLLDTKLKISQQHSLGAEVANTIQGHSRRTVASRSRTTTCLLTMDETGRSAVSSLGLPVQDRHGHTGVNPAKRCGNVK